MRRSFLRNSIVILVLLSTLSFSSIEAVAQVTCSWGPSPESVIGYKIYYGTASRSYTSSINVGNVTTYTVQGLSVGVTYYFAATAYNQFGESDYSNEASGRITETVSSPPALAGPTSGFTGTSYTYTTGGSSSSLGHSVQYSFNWGDGTSSGWLPVGTTSASHSWTTAGTYYVKAQARCAAHTSVVSTWSGTLSVTIVSATTNPTVSIVASTPAVPEAGPGQGVFTISRTGSTSASLTAYYTVGGTSTFNVDRNGINTYLTIPAGASSGTVSIIPINDTLCEGDETVILTLSTNAAYTVAAPPNNSATVTIIDDDCVTKPTVTTSAASGIGQTGATLNGTVDPNGASTTANFQWGTSTSYGNNTSSQSMGSGTSGVALTQAISSLTCNTVYHYRAVGTNSAGTNYGSDMSFTTSACSPVIDPIILDNAAAGQSGGGRTFAGSWCVSAAEGYYGTDSLFSCGSGTDTYRWTPTIPAAGSYDVYIWWSPYSTRSTTVPIAVTHGAGTTTKTYNQQTGGGQWVLHGTYSFNAGTGGYVQVSAANGQACADAVKFVPASEIVLDNAAAGQSGGGRTFAGSWCVSAAEGYYGTDSLFSCGSGTNTYRWTPTIPEARSYNVYVWWSPYSTRSTTVPVAVTHAAGTTTKTANEQTGGGGWVLHGNYNFNAGTGGYVEVSDINGQACADAVRFEPWP